MDPELKQIRTFQGDVANAINKKKESLVSIQRAESAKREAAGASTEEAEKEPLKVFMLVVGTLFLLGAGALGGWYTYSEYIKKTTPPVISIPANRLISSAREVSVNSSGLTVVSLAAILAEERGSDLIPVGHISHINVPLTTQEFFTLLGTRAPGYLTRALEEVFMLGVLGGESASTFLIIEITSFENVFAGMLEWEEDMFEDLRPLLGVGPRITPEGAPVEAGAFRDILSKNKNIRALYGEDGASLLAYTFFDNDTLVITDTEEALQTIIGRLSSELLTR